MSRTKNSLRNIIYALTSQFLVILIQFFSRRIFLNYLGINYLGISSLFTNVISILSLAELGVGTAIIYNLYKTVAANNEQKTAALLNYYEKIYTYIMIGILLIGILIFPFLDIIIKDKPNIPYVNYYYFFFLATTVSSYFSVYKSSIIVAKQKEYIVTSFRFITSITIKILQIIVLVLTKNYTLFLTVNFIGVIIKNVALTQYVNKKYPNLVNKDFKIDKKTKYEIGQNIKGMIFQKIGGVMVDSTDNIIISSFVGLSYVGLYSNYYMVILALRKIIKKLFKPITASLGNLCAINNREKSFKVFNSIFLINFWLVSYMSIGVINCINPFVQLWVGKEHLINFNVTIIIALNFYLKCMRETLILFKNANGLYWEERYKGISEAFVNLIVSIIFVKIFGFIGVLIGTTFSSITTVLWIEPYILYKNYFKENSLFNYFKKYIFYLIIFVFLSVLTLFINNAIFEEITLINLIVRVLLLTIIVNGFYIILFYKCKEFKLVKKTIKSIALQKLI